jgi:outer membrane protein TolC
LHAIERAVITAIASAEAEEQGLKRRLEQARARLSILVGNDTYEDLDREEHTDQQLTASEREFSAAEQRLGQLISHLEHLHRVLETVKPQ